MLGFVLVSIAIMAIVLLALGVAMAFDVTFGDGHRIVMARLDEGRRWRPPYVSGRELYSWARSIARKMVGEVIEESNGAASPAEFTDRLNRGAARAMFPELRSPEGLRAVPCPHEGQGVISVSAPEVLQIADYLRRHLSDGELARLRERAARKAATLEGSDCLTADADPCALQGERCMCEAYPERPLACRPLHAAVLAKELGLDPTAFGDSGSIEDHMEIVGFGVAEGLAEGLGNAGLDANRYELHSALGRALEHPDAADRWALGEDVFAGCQIRRMHPTALAGPSGAEGAF